MTRIKHYRLVNLSLPVGKIVEMLIRQSWKRKYGSLGASPKSQLPRYA